MAEGELTDKQRVWVEIYLQTWNATEAARRAGYEGNDVTLASVGYENLRKPQIAAFIKARLADKAMETDEVLARLADQARGTLEDFVYIGPKGAVKIDLAKAKRAGKLHLLRKYSKGKGGIVSFELYDAQAALVHIGKHLGLFPDEVKHSGAIDLKEKPDLSKLSDDELNQLSDLLGKAVEPEAPAKPATDPS